MKGIKMVIGMKDNLRREKLTVKESIHGLMVKFMMENGFVGSKKGREFGRV